MHQKYYALVDGLNELFDPIMDVMTKPITPTSKDELLSEYHSLVENNAFEKFVDSVLARTEEDAEFCPFWTSNTEAPIAASSNAVLSLRYHDEQSAQASLYGVPSDIYFTLLYSTGSVRIHIYDIDKQDYSLTHETTLNLKDKQTIRLKKGQTFKVETQGIACFSRLLIGLGESTHVYDANTLQYLSMLSLNPISSRWYFMARVASLLEKSAAKNILEKLTKHDNYNVRWVALQQLFEVDQELACKILQAFQDDVHPFIAKKAKAEWTRILPLLAS
jgi:hypothetical protein